MYCNIAFLQNSGKLSAFNPDISFGICNWLQPWDPSMLAHCSSRQTPIITSKLLWHWNPTIGRQIRTMERIVTLRAKIHMAHQTSHDATAVLPHCWEMTPVGLLIFIHQLIITTLAMVWLFCWDPIVPHSVKAMSEIISLKRTFCHPYCRNHGYPYGWPIQHITSLQLIGHQKKEDHRWNWLDKLSSFLEWIKYKN
jgi:hypothetical protein